MSELLNNEQKIKVLTDILILVKGTLQTQDRLMTSIGWIEVWPEMIEKIDEVLNLVNH